MRQASLRRIAEFSVRPNRELGQHFLIDDNILRVIGALAALDPADVVLEVGGGVGEVQGGVPVRGERVGERRLERAIDLDDVEVRDARGHELRQDAETPSDLEHDVLRRQLGEVADDAQDVVVDQEVLPQLPVRTNGEPLEAAKACLSHHLNTRLALASTSASSSS